MSLSSSIISKLPVNGLTWSTSTAKWISPTEVYPCTKEIIGWDCRKWFMLLRCQLYYLMWITLGEVGTLWVQHVSASGRSLSIWEVGILGFWWLMSIIPLITLPLISEPTVYRRAENETQYVTGTMPLEFKINLVKKDLSTRWFLPVDLEPRGKSRLHLGVLLKIISLRLDEFQRHKILFTVLDVGKVIAKVSASNVDFPAVSQQKVEVQENVCVGEKQEEPAWLPKLVFIFLKSSV